MKVLSLTEPYATLILNGVKSIETRSWRTKYRGKLYIHASSTRMPKAYRENRELSSLVDYGHLNYGFIICSCELTDCVEMTDAFIDEIRKNRSEYAAGIYERGRYAWILENVVALKEPIRARGYLGIWTLD